MNTTSSIFSIKNRQHYLIAGNEPFQKMVSHLLDVVVYETQIQKHKKIGSMGRWLHKEVGLYKKWHTVKQRWHIQAGQAYLFTRAIICHGIIAIPGMKRDKRWHKLHLLACKVGQIRWAVEILVHFVCKNALREREDSIEKGNREEYNKPFPSETNDVHGQTILTLQFFNENCLMKILQDNISQDFIKIHHTHHTHCYVKEVLQNLIHLIKSHQF